MTSRPSSRVDPLMTSNFANCTWPTRGPHFNPWHEDVAKFTTLIQNNPTLWLKNFQLKYLDLRVDTRSGHFIVMDRDGNRVSPDDIVRAATA